MPARQRERHPPPIDDTLIRSLCSPARYAHQVEAVRVIETHISWVLLTGEYAYKIKKPVRLPFLDFSTLARRRAFCEEELRLNRRFAPDLYLGIVSIGGSAEEPVLEAEPAIEYAVRLREFPEGARLDERLEAGEIPAADMLDLAETISRFHGSLPASKTFGNPVAITRAALGNLQQTQRALQDYGSREPMEPIREWMTRRCVELERAFEDRKRRGAIREAHGDLHLENLVYWHGRIVPFDALEFDPRLRWIDVMDETAFLFMDLLAHERPGLAYEFLNRYLELTGDYAGLAIFRFYLVHRALVRAKVAALKGSQGSTPRERRATKRKITQYLSCAARLIEPEPPLLVITHGPSGSGKTSGTNGLIPRLPALRCRSDIERKRLHGLAPREKSGSALGAGLYAADATRQTYDTLLGHAALALRVGLSIVVDATFLKLAERESFAKLAARERARFAILDFTAPDAVLRERVRRRAARGGDASEATLEVLDNQLATGEPFDAEELAFVVPVDSAHAVDPGVLEQRLRTSRTPLRGRASPPSERPFSP